MKKIFMFIFCFLIVENTFAQSASMVPNQSLLRVNPSYAGSNGGIRNQSFAEIPYSRNEFNIYNFSNALDCYLPSLKSGIGLSLNYESVGDFIRNRSANLNYSRPFKINEKLKIVPALQLAYERREINDVWMYSPSGALQQKGWIGTERYSFASSVLINYKSFYGGLVIFNEKNAAGNKSNLALYYFSTTWQFNASYNLNIANNFQINFSEVFISRISGSQNLISVNGLFYKHLLFGVSGMRQHLGLNAGLKTDYFTAQISYKNYTGKLMPEYTGDYWQFMLSFNLRNKELRHAVTNFEEW